jgi:hypothetical protein
MHFKALVDDLKQADAKRADMPGEHLIVLGVGLLLLLASGRSRSLLGKAVVGAAAGAFIGRAASGTGGASRWAETLRHAASRLR